MKLRKRNKGGLKIKKSKEYRKKSTSKKKKVKFMKGLIPEILFMKIMMV